MVKIIYDEHYKKEAYFGAPYKGLIEFFSEYKPKGKVLDLGCGQGRDAVALAKLGYHVIGIDHSTVGIEALNKKAALNHLEIETLVADVYKVDLDHDTDIVLLDSMLHFYKNHIKKEEALVRKLLNQLKIGGLIVNVMLKGKVRQAVLKDIVNASDSNFEILRDHYVDYPEASAKYHMLVIKKVK